MFSGGSCCIILDGFDSQRDKERFQVTEDGLIKMKEVKAKGIKKREGEKKMERK